MKKEIAEQWAAELRSGKYKQGAAYLKYENCYCCLGVLCEISNISNFEETSFEDVDRIDADEYFGCNTELPNEVMEWSGMRNEVGDFLDVAIKSELRLNKYTSLTAANDSGVSFLEIADFIEKHWEEL